MAGKAFVTSALPGSPAWAIARDGSVTPAGSGQARVVTARYNPSRSEGLGNRDQRAAGKGARQLRAD
jgi:hypothetical protein